ncbi:DUF3859 domain-containing protein [Pseudomonas sp. NPDC087612]|uniref:DUF3859 domain-containing protein n=1 Tax=Pseudomonas TaxID=286 RepID=UPI0005EB5DDD|nr:MULTISPECIES: DUF3859 domain-containing protein [unclassified Pseudomonas]KJK14361.1 helicase [Pseudomonas sp. 2(2015)]NLU59911.1 DUF3859 domain-containing protein [Pseudomonas sp. BIGb0427]QPG60967.1 DUF3859 domain-containing protein [Pseudomonas sp. BIGb0427]QVM95118.1 DUF3859 domain-containing protein [Pseudomonas sp. SORT22]UVL58014.1 DUF3859 domain-containing protein [Pseudomonas sp. B21-035]
MFPRRFSALCGLLLVSGLAAAEVRVEGPVEYGLFETRHQNFQPGERVLSQSNQTIQPTDEIPARLGSKFGMRYRLEGKVAEDTPLTLLYLTPGVRTPDGKRHDKFEVVQKLVPGAVQDVMAYEFTENHEVVPGQWHFMVFQGDRLLAEQRFTVR